GGGGTAAPESGEGAFIPGVPSRSHPIATLTASSTSLATLRRSGLKVRVSGAVPSGTLRLTVSRAIARKLGLRGTTLASVRIAKAGTARLRVTKRTARALARVRSLPADLRLGAAAVPLTLRR
ncbi:MAG TPA: hypothetical protein VN238_03060, partial [Solirubrobacteraceae bacterium]|nr:hypothetical protein [Solirubrobacteraceae bacterium]